MTLNLTQFSLKDGFKGTPPLRPPETRKVSNLRDATVPFIKGPIPLAWIMAAAMLPGKCRPRQLPSQKFWCGAQAEGPLPQGNAACRPQCKR